MERGHHDQAVKSANSESSEIKPKDCKTQIKQVIAFKKKIFGA